MLKAAIYIYDPGEMNVEDGHLFSIPGMM